MTTNKYDSELEERMAKFLKFKDGRSYEEHKREAEMEKLNERKEKEINQKLKELTEATDIKGLRRFINRTPEIHNFNVRILNEDFPMTEHRFVKRHGVMNIVKDLRRNPSTTNSVSNKETANDSNSVNDSETASDNESINTSNNEFINDSDNESINTSNNEFINDSNNEFTNDRIDELVNDNQLIYQNINSLTDRLTVIESKYECAKQKIQELIQKINGIVEEINLIEGKLNQ